MLSTSSKFAIVLLAAALLGGCRFKGWESFSSAVSVPDAPRTLPGDPGASGGIAMATGGHDTVTRYGEGARKDVTAPLSPSYDQPAKGSGQQPGEGTIEAAPGYAHENGPSMQNLPGAVSSSSTRSKY
jgi:hypothetical protein